jgi:hypothetical protein
MNRLLQDNPIGLALAGTCAFLLLCMLLISLSSFLPLGSSDSAEPGPEEGAALELPELKQSEPLEHYSVIVQRPLFNETRLPVIGADTDSAEPEEELVADDTKLEMELSGVVITPTLRMATLKRTDGSKSLVAIEGKPLEGEFGSWQLAEVESRKVRLVSGAGKELELELQVHDERIEPPDLPVAPASEPQTTAGVDPAQQAEQQPATESLSRADEIRQRIAERREQLRQQAEAEDQAGDQDAQPSYEEAIRAMINRRQAPEQKPDTENEQ